MKNAVVLWTGGKDSCLALHIAQEQNLNILSLVTFVPRGNLEFSSHPQSEMRTQAKRLGLEIHFVEINGSYKPSYIEAMNWIKTSRGASTVVTGDIDLVDGLPNWIVECCEGLEIEVVRPLWKKSREWVMNELLDRGIQARISKINHQAIPKDWHGRLIDAQLLDEMRQLSSKTDLDLAGENGEYHTMVVEAPAFSRIT